MTKLSDVSASLGELKKRGPNLCAVIVGVTSGVGEATAKALATYAKAPKIFLVGRKQDALSRVQEELKSINASGQYIPVETGDLTLIKNVDRACEALKSEPHIDMLIMSQGFINFSAREENEEGLDKLTSIRYYSRMQFITNLLPQLNKATSPSVVTVLAGDGAGPVPQDDLSLKNPANYSVIKAGGAASTYTTLFLERLHADNPRVSFVHTFPGLVKTNLWWRDEHFSRWTQFFFRWILHPILTPMFYSVDEVGQRTLFAATDERFRPHHGSDDSSGALQIPGSNGDLGSGVYTLNDKSESVVEKKILPEYRKNGIAEKIVDHTISELHRAVSV